MVRKRLVGLCVWGLVMGLECLAVAGIPDLVQCTVTCATTLRVSVYCLPDGTGNSLRQAQPFNRPVGAADATITLTVRDPAGAPIPFYARGNMWLETSLGGMKHCPGGTMPEAATNAQGRTMFVGPFRAGGHSDPGMNEGCVVIIGGARLPAAAFDILFNSPDIDGNLVVNLTDTVLYTANAGSGGAYDYRSDFYWDGVINLSDTVLFARGLGTTCP